MTHALHWFRADLRVTDNKALQVAMEFAQQLTTVFIYTPETWKSHASSPAKMQFMQGCLENLSTNLAKQGVPLIFIEKSRFIESVTALIQLCDEHGITRLYFNKQYELDEVRRDEAVVEALTSIGVECYAYDDQTIVPPGKISTLSGEPYKVFTPFKKAWLKEVMVNLNHYQPVISSRKHFIQDSSVISRGMPQNIKRFEKQELSTLFLPGENHALEQLSTFASHALKNYHLQRDFPSMHGTSHLSPALTIGALSPRTCLAVILKKTQVQLYDDHVFPGELTWLSELIWRDFYKHIIFYYPRLCRHEPFKHSTDHLSWKTDSTLLLAWQKGQTGFPIVDAAMRQLNQTGWMHNRLRMVTAMFLTKTLFVDWRLGERYFMENLIDGDFSANNGGWQWCASTGTDAVPYFRIFNPTTQSERFDKDGEFIRQFCPELSSLSNKHIHDPYGRGIDVDRLNYPRPIVDYKVMRAYVLDQFKENVALER